MAISKIGSKALVDCSVAATDIADGSITAAKLAGSIANAKLANSSITVNGTSVSLGASGSIPAVSWQSVKTNSDSPVTLVAGNGYFMDTTSGVITATLPGSPSAGDTIAIKDYAGTFATNNLTIGRNGNNIQGVANDSLISTNRASLTLVYVDATKGWLYAVESNVDNLQAPTFISATGGTITTSGDFKIHSFTGDGCFVVSSLGGNGTPCAVSSKVDYLVIAGGGSGGICGGGGGGAGGFRESKDSTLSSPHTASPLAATTGITLTTQTYPVTVGGGGTGISPPASENGNPGSNSVFSTITSAGGGGGGAFDNVGATPAPRAALTGGSGGGSSGLGPTSPNPGAAGNTPPVTPPQGNSGGSGQHIGGDSMGSGGGGGATAAGSNGLGQTPAPLRGAGGAGGAGATTSITGSPIAYAGGGGGAGFGACGTSAGSPCGTGGAGGRNNANASIAGTTNKGGGGGGGAHSGGGPNGSSSGGKGIVIIRYKYQ